MRSVIWHFDLLAPVYDRLIAPVLGSPDPERWRELLRLPAAGWILDAGGGTGRISAPLQTLAGNIIVTDLSRRMLARAKERGLEAVLGDVEQLPFADGTFERVLVVDALHHFAAQQSALREMLRVLRPGGRLVVEELDLRRFPVKLVAFGERLAGMKSRFRPADVIAGMMAAEGMSVRIEEDNGWAVWIIAEKPMREE
jgi:ubiquinone/menaquinone biosynthesis C-methylase UbiE